MHTTAPIVTAQISIDGTLARLGMNYFLNCIVSGAETLDATITYQWTKNNGTQT